MTLAFVAGLALQAVAPAPAPAPGPCEVDRRIMLALGMDAFDQDHQGGWRPLSERPGCKGSAADLIRDYRAFTQESPFSTGTRASSAPISARMRRPRA